MRLKDQVAIVTGSAAGIGRAIVQRFVREGAQVVQADVQRRLSGASVAPEDARVREIPTDVRDRSQVDALVAEVLDSYGRIDILVNNAGITGSNGPFHEVSLETWDRVLAVNLTGVFHCAQAVARAMILHNIHGRIVNIGSVNSYAAESHASAYVAAKGGVLLLTKAMAVDLAPFGITVNCLAPGPTAHEGTDAMFSSEPLRSGLARTIPLGRAATGDEVADAAVFLASDACTYITGTSLVIDGGLLAYLGMGVERTDP